VIKSLSVANKTSGYTPANKHGTTNEAISTFLDGLISCEYTLNICE